MGEASTADEVEKTSNSLAETGVGSPVAKRRVWLQSSVTRYAFPTRSLR